MVKRELQPRVTMLSQAEIKNKYVDLYREMRRYIWGFEVVEVLADVEIEAYKVCPDLEQLRRSYSNLVGMTRDVCRDDEDLNRVVEVFGDTINSANQTFAKLDQVKEVV